MARAEAAALGAFCLRYPLPRPCIDTATLSKCKNSSEVLRELGEAEVAAQGSDTFTLEAPPATGRWRRRRRDLRPLRRPRLRWRSFHTTWAARRASDARESDRIARPDAAALPSPGGPGRRRVPSRNMINPRFLRRSCQRGRGQWGTLRDGEGGCAAKSLGHLRRLRPGPSWTGACAYVCMFIITAGPMKKL